MILVSIPGLDSLVAELSGVEIVLEISRRLCRSCGYGEISERCHFFV